MKKLSRETNIQIHKYGDYHYTFDSDRLRELEKIAFETGKFKDRSDINKILKENGISPDSYRKWKSNRASPPKDDIKLLAEIFELESEYELLNLAEHLETEREYGSIKRDILARRETLELLLKDIEFYQKEYEDNVAVHAITAKQIEENEVQIFVKHKTETDDLKLIVEQGDTPERLVIKYGRKCLFLSKEKFASVYHGIQTPVVRVQVEIVNETDIEIMAWLDDGYPMEEEQQEFSFELMDVEEAKDLDPDDIYGIEDFPSEDIEERVRECLDEFGFTEYEKEHCMIESVWG